VLRLQTDEKYKNCRDATAHRIFNPAVSHFLQSSAFSLKKGKNKDTSTLTTIKMEINVFVDI
jgi:hypothetical protein